MIVSFAPFPSSSPAADRLLVRILARSRRVDPLSTAVEAAGLGVEVTEIGNAASFDDGPTELLVPPGLRGADRRVLADLDRLAERFGASIVWVDSVDDDNVVSLVVGPDSKT